MRLGLPMVNDSVESREANTALKIAPSPLRIDPLDKNESLTSRDSKSYERSLRRYFPT